MNQNPTIEPTPPFDAMDLIVKRRKNLEELKNNLNLRPEFINKHRKSFIDALLASYKTVKDRVEHDINNVDLSITEKTEKIGLDYISANLPMASALLMLGADGAKLKMELAKMGEGGEDLIAAKMMYLTIINAADEKESEIETIEGEKDMENKSALENKKDALNKDKNDLYDAAKAIEAVLYSPQEVV